MNETYRLTLTHYIDDEKNHIPLEEPLVVQMVYDRTQVPLPICLNRMMDMMRGEILSRAEREEKKR